MKLTEVVQALEDGKTVEWRSSRGWLELDPEKIEFIKIIQVINENHLRIKPELSVVAGFGGVK